MNKYEKQASANIAALNWNPDYSERLKTLYKIAKCFEKENVMYSFTCSFGLFLQGIVDNFHDFDLLVAPKSFKKVTEILDLIGSKKTYDKDPSRQEHFCSQDFAEYTVDGIDIDVICEFGFTTFDISYIYHFNEAERLWVDMNDLHLPIVCPEAQMVFYDMMTGWQPQRSFKRDLVKEYLKASGLKNRLILERAIREELPYQVKANIAEMLR